MPTRTPGPREMPEATYQWFKRTHAFFSGLQHLERHWGGEATTIRWVLDHGYDRQSAEAEAMQVVDHYCERLIGQGY